MYLERATMSFSWISKLARTKQQPKGTLLQQTSTYSHNQTLYNLFCFVCISLTQVGCMQQNSTFKHVLYTTKAGTPMQMETQQRSQQGTRNLQNYMENWARC
jgi:uncharacterized membrane protein